MSVEFYSVLLIAVMIVSSGRLMVNQEKHYRSTWALTYQFVTTALVIALVLMINIG